METLIKVRVYVALSLLTFAALSSTAFATPINGADTLASVRLSATVVQAIVSAFLPLLVGLLTHVKDSAFVKGALQLILNAVSAFVVQATLADGSAVVSKSTVMVFLVGVATSLVAYYNAWKPAGVTSSLTPVKTIDPQTQLASVSYVPGSLSTKGLRTAA